MGIGEGGGVTRCITEFAEVVTAVALCDFEAVCKELRNTIRRKRINNAIMTRLFMLL